MKVEDFEKTKLLTHFNNTPGLQSAAYDLGMMPEQLEKDSPEYAFLLGMIIYDMMQDEKEK